MKKKIAILGSTGSIGKTLVNIIKKDNKNFEIILLSADGNYNELVKQAKYFKVIQPYQYHTRIPAPSNIKRFDTHIMHLGGAAPGAETTEAHILITKLSKPIRVLEAHCFTQEQSAASATLTLYHGSTFVAGNETADEQFLDVSEFVRNKSNQNLLHGPIDMEHLNHYGYKIVSKYIFDNIKLK